MTHATIYKVGYHYEVNANLTSNGQSTTKLHVRPGIASVSLSGTFTATVALQRSFNDGDTWVTVESYTGATEKNMEIGEPMFIRFNVTAFTSGTIVAHLGQWYA